MWLWCERLISIYDFISLHLKKYISLPAKEPFHFDVRGYNRALVLSLTFVAALLLSRELDNTSRSRRHTFKLMNISCAIVPSSS